MHINTAQERHAEIDAKIQEELKRPYPDYELLGRLKKQKLILKDEIERRTKKD